MNDVDDVSFEGAIARGAVLVDFWAAWCAPCLALEPVLAEIAHEHEGTLAVVRLNIQDSPRTAERYAVKTVPTLILFKDGNPVQRLFGRRKRQLLDEIGDLR